MQTKLSRREWLATSLCLPPLSAFSASPSSPPKLRKWNEPVPLGRTGLKVTPLGMGGENLETTRRAAEMGINHFNVFTSAGDLTELERAGQALKGVRQRVLIAIDCDGLQRLRRRAAGLPAMVASPGENTRQNVLADLDVQLTKLGTDYVDLWYLTSKRMPEEISDELMEAVRVAKQAGKVRACAASTHGFPSIVPRVLELRGEVGALMLTCNFANWTTIADHVARLRAAGIGIVAMKPLMGGLGYVPESRKAWAASLDTEEKRRAALAAALKWVIQNPNVDTAPVSMDTLDELGRNVKAASSPLAGDEAELLASAVERISPYYCRNCGSCEGACRYGLPVSDMLRALMYADGYGNLGRARAVFGEAPAALKAVRCEDCGACTVRCPNGVRVAERLARAQSLLAPAAPGVAINS